MAHMVSLDTNVLLRFLLNDVPEQAVKAASVIQRDKVYVTDVVVVETVYVMERVMQLERSDIVQLLEGFLGFANVVHNPFFLVNVLRWYEKAPALSIVDCYAATEAGAYHNRLATFEKKLANQGGKHVVRL